MSAPNAPIRFEGLWQDWLGQCHLNEYAVPVAPSPCLRGLLDLSTAGWACPKSCPPEAGRAPRCSLPFLPEKSTSQQSHGCMQHKLHVVERVQRMPEFQVVASSWRRHLPHTSHRTAESLPVHQEDGGLRWWSAHQCRETAPWQAQADSLSQWATSLPRSGIIQTLAHTRWVYPTTALAVPAFRLQWHRRHTTPAWPPRRASWLRAAQPGHTWPP